MTDQERVVEADERTPWGFVVFVVLAALYVLLRLIQMAGWLIDWVA